MSAVVGHVDGVLRYPVKSMLGEALGAAEVTERGLAGDRTYAVVDRETGRIASAKAPRLWRGLLGMAARTTGDAPGVRITLRDGTVLDGTGEATDAALSRELGRPVTLAGRRADGAAIDRAVPEAVLEAGEDADVPTMELTLGEGSPGASFVDYAPLHLITTATLARIGELGPRGTVEVARYRPNLVVRTSTTGFAEDAWLGAVLALGDEVRLRVVLPTPRCAVPSLAHGDLPADPHAVRVPFRHHRREVLDLGETGCAGVYLEVLRAGVVREGDEVRVDERPAQRA